MGSSCSAPQESYFSDRWVLVTGASRGLGRALAVELARRGAHLALWARSVPELQEAAREVQAAAPGSHCVVQQVDVAVRDEVYRAAERLQRAVRERGGERVEIVFSNAGVVSGRPFLETPDEAITRTFAVNALGNVWLAKAFLPAWREAGEGHLVTVSSAAGLVGVAGLADYCASKAAALAFNDALRMELAGAGLPGVRVTSVCPFFIRTALFAGVEQRNPLLPVLSVDEVVEGTLGALEEDPGARTVAMPWAVKTAPLFALLDLLRLPRLHALAYDFLAVGHYMKGFHGRSLLADTPPPPAPAAPAPTGGFGARKPSAGAPRRRPSGVRRVSLGPGAPGSGARTASRAPALLAC
eukprot:tig00001264_g7881.t1